MKAWEIEEIRRAVTGKWLMRPEVMLRKFNGRVCTDSRKAAAGDLFIAIKGERFDAHEFLRDVLSRDVAAALVHQNPSPELLALAKERECSLILVDDTIAALNRLAAAYRANELGGGFRAKVIAVGGSNGKTTTKRIIHALLAERFGDAAGHASPASFNNNIGMPLTLLEVAPAHEYVVVEIGTNAPGEIRALAQVCKPDVAVITSVGLEHLEKLVDLAGVAREEAAVAEFVTANGLIVIPDDVPPLADALRATKVRLLRVGRDARQAELHAADIRETLEGTSFTNTRNTFTVPLLGEHNAVNALMAIAVARRFGATDAQISAGLAKVKAAPGRMELLRFAMPQGEEGAGRGVDWAVIHDAYNANPTSMAAALRTFAHLTATAEGPKRRRVAILADMLELGVTSDQHHRDVGTLASTLQLDLLIAIGPSMRLAAENTRIPVHTFESTVAARDGLVTLLDPNDAILLKGSHGMHLETLLETLKSGMDRPVQVGR